MRPRFSEPGLFTFTCYPEILLMLIECAPTGIRTAVAGQTVLTPSSVNATAVVPSDTLTVVGSCA